MNVAHELQPVRIFLAEDGLVTILDAENFSPLDAAHDDMVQRARITQSKIFGA